ncbi:AraC family ligand binding domain-containing protein [Kitasatospora sp. NPDC051170]|uniref:AraC family ligand binding domain-containing protein n=1 Tax=Kitasatospora sp. NPDC051170 TaxID=3364056 RepID=UPI0037B4113C
MAPTSPVMSRAMSRSGHSWRASGAQPSEDTVPGARSRPSSGRTRAPAPAVHVLALVASGTGTHEVDFRHYRLRSGSVVWVRPGTVHRWSDIDTCDGPLVLFRTGAPADRRVEETPAPICLQLDPQRLGLALHAAERRLPCRRRRALHHLAPGGRLRRSPRV